MDKVKNNWIWVKDWALEMQKEPVMMYFRRDNGRLCGIGPSKGDRNIWFYDEIDVASFLKKGHNIWAVEILRYPLDDQKSNMSLFRTETPGLYIESTEQDENGIPLWRTDESWKVKQNMGFHIVSENPYFAPMQIYENNAGDAEVFGWMQEGYNDSKCFFRSRLAAVFGWFPNDYDSTLYDRINRY